jgi:hypothetical protein
MMLLRGCFIILFAILTGCFSQTSSASPAPGAHLSTVEPRKLALRPLEIPGYFVLEEEWERTAADMNPWALDKGWKKGYGIYYEKKGPDARFFQQAIPVYAVKNISLVVPDTMNKWKNWSTGGNNSVEELLSPGIGDGSSALNISNDDDPVNTYIISFVKFDVYQELCTNGSATDYETLKHLANTAAAKIQ